MSELSLPPPLPTDLRSLPSLPTSPVTSSANLRLHFSIRRGSSLSDPSAVPHYTSDFPSLIWLLYLLHSHQSPSSSTLPGCYPGMIHRAQDRDSRQSRKRKREPLLQGKSPPEPCSPGPGQHQQLWAAHAAPGAVLHRCCHRPACSGSAPWASLSSSGFANARSLHADELI